MDNNIAWEDLYGFIDTSGTHCLNEKKEHNCRDLFKKEDSAYLESDSDEQLLLTVSFRGEMKINSLQLKAPNDGRAPKTIKFFLNQPHMDFSNTDSTPSIHIIPLRSGEHVCANSEDAEWGYRKGYLMTGSLPQLKSWWHFLSTAIKEEYNVERAPKWTEMNHIELMKLDATRRQFVHDYQQLEMDYSIKIKSFCQSKLKNELDGLFVKLCTLAEILQTGHSTLVNKIAITLADSKADPGNLMIGKPFSEALHTFNIYELLSTELPLLQDKLEQMKEKDKKGNFASLLGSIEVSHDFTVASLLDRMGQKVYQIRKLLLDVLVHTKTEHPDYPELVQAEGQARVLSMKIQRATGPHAKRPERMFPAKRTPHQFTNKLKEIV